VGEGEDRARGQLYITARVVSCVLQTWKSFVHIYLPRTGIFREGKNEDTAGKAWNDSRKVSGSGKISVGSWQGWPLEVRSLKKSFSFFDVRVAEVKDCSEGCCLGDLGEKQSHLLHNRKWGGEKPPLS
jgi:hypothetical protein